MKKIKISVDKRGAIVSSAAVVFTVLSDFFSKRAVMANMEIGESIPIIKNVFHFTYITNPGAAFGSLSGKRWVFMTASVLMIAALAALILFWDDKSTLFYASASMILGGGVGNMIDRIFYGEVVDFLDFCAFPRLWSYIFNLADAFVCVGVGLLLLYVILSEVKRAREEKERTEEGGKDGQAEP